MSDENKVLTVHLSTWSVMKIILVLATVWLFFLLRDIVLIFYVALILAAAINPWADLAEKYKIPRGLATIAVYIILIGVFSLSFILLIDPLVAQFGEFMSNFPMIWEKAAKTILSFQSFSVEHGFYKQLKDALLNVNLDLGTRASGLISFTRDIIQSVFSLLIVLILTFFLTSSSGSIKKIFRFLAPNANQDILSDVYFKSQEKIGGWLRGQVILCFFIFALAYAVLLLLGVKYSLVLALFAGITEFIPYVGPIIGAIPAVIVAFFQEPKLALWVIIAYTLIQQLENTVLVPKIMQKTVGLSPIASILALLIGAKIAGVIGLILAIPSAAIIAVIIEEKNLFKK